MTFLEKLQAGPVLFDGAFGTYYARKLGCRSGSCEQANLTAPDQVEIILKEYVAAGADAITANTFSVSRESLGDKAETVIRTGCDIALRAAAGTDVAVFADLGPLSHNHAEEYKRMAGWFLDCGVTHFLFETLESAAGVGEAAAFIKEQCPEAFVIVSFAVGPGGFTREGLSGRELLLSVQEDPNIDAAGFNCVSGPHHHLRQVKGLPALKKPLYICPNESYPTLEEGLARFGDNPGYFAHLLLEIVDAGAAIVGGCCGTTPTHIRTARQLLSERQARPAIPAAEKGVKATALPPINSSLWDKLERGETVIAAELDPPAVSDIRKFLRNAQNLTEAGADTITVADCPVARVRADSSMMAAKLKRELGVDPLPHMTCRDRNLNATRALLLGLSIEEIHNVLVITGDPVPSADRGEVKGVWSYGAAGLAGYVRALSQEGTAAPFHIWGALNVNVVNFAAELHKAKRKMESGVCAFLTQPVFTPQSLENLALARRELKGAYILAGILPVISYRSAIYMNSEVAGITIPEEVVEQYREADKDVCRQLAIDHSLRLAADARPHCDGFYLITPAARPSVGVDVVRELRKRF